MTRQGILLKPLQAWRKRKLIIIDQGSIIEARWNKRLRWWEIKLPNHTFLTTTNQPHFTQASTYTPIPNNPFTSRDR
jgi:hypothetical protein